MLLSNGGVRVSETAEAAHVYNGPKEGSMNRIVALSLLLLVSGCLVSSSHEERVTGNYVADNTFSQIQPGKTTAGWVKATLGDPSTKTEVKESGTEVWKYQYTEHKDGSGAIF